MDKREEYIKTLENACKSLIVLYRDNLYNGFVAAHRIKEWVNLCEILGEPTEHRPKRKG